MTEAEVMKVEFHVIGEDGEAFAWEDNLEAALHHVGPKNAPVKRIEKVTYYFEARETVWPFDVSERRF